MNAKEYKKLTKAATADELYKLKASKEFQLMHSVKGPAVEDWNW